MHERTGAALPKPYKITSSWQLMWTFLSKTVRHKFHECGRRNHNLGGRGVICSWPGLLQPHEAGQCQQVLDHADIDAIGRSVRSPVLNQWTPSVMSHTTATVSDDLVQVWDDIPRKLSTVLSGADILGSACRGQPCCWALSCLQKVTDHTAISSVPWDFEGYSKTNPQ